MKRYIYDHASPAQLRTIAQLCQALGIKESVEEKPMSVFEAGRMIRELSNRVKALKVVKK